MTKKILAIAAMLLVSVNPFLSSIHADANGWLSPIASAAWTYDGYRVERLIVAPHTVGPVAFGDAVLVATLPSACLEDACNRVHVLVFKNGLSKAVEHVPLSAFSTDRFVKNGNRFLFVSPVDALSETFAVKELDTHTASVEVLLPRVIIPGGSNVDVMVDGNGKYFFTADIRFSNANRAFTQRSLFVWDTAQRIPVPIVENPSDRRLSLLDVRQGIALAKMTFPSGQKQLWLYDTNPRDGHGGFVSAVPGSWTEANDDIQYARFTSIGMVEFMRYFSRQMYTPGSGNQSTVMQERLSWNHPITETIKTDGKNLAWVDAEDTLFASDGIMVTKVGIAPGGSFAIERGRLYFNGHVMDLTTKNVTATPFTVVDASGTAIAGLDAESHVLLRSASRAVLTVGFGMTPVLSDASHVYWRGFDDGLYAATVMPPVSTATVFGAHAWRTADSPTVYLIQKDTRRPFANERMYKTWFKNWSAVEIVSASALAQVPLGTSAPIAPGALVKKIGDTRIYALAKDGVLHQVGNARVGYALFGETWYAKIVEVTEMDLIPYPISFDLRFETDAVGLF